MNSNLFGNFQNNFLNLLQTNARIASAVTIARAAIPDARVIFILEILIVHLVHSLFLLRISLFARHAFLTSYYFNYQLRAVELVFTILHRNVSFPSRIDERERAPPSNCTIFYFPSRTMTG